MYMAQWKPDNASKKCDSCAKRFEFFRRRHHCRICGGLFCYSCSNIFLPVERILLRRLEMHWYGETIRKMAAIDTTTSEKGPLTTMERSFATLLDSSGALQPATMAPQRVCVQCFEDVETYSNSLKKSLSRQWCMDSLLGAASSGDYPSDWKCWRDKNVLLLGGRERKVCVILLQDNGVVESGERTNLRELFHALEQLTNKANARTTQGQTSSKDTTPSLGPSLSSVSDISESEKNSFETSIGREGTTATTIMMQQSALRCPLSKGTPTKYRKKIVLQVPIPLNTSDSTDRTSSMVTANLSVRMQLVGVTHRQGFDKALLQQHTIGTDAYIILLDGELVSTVDTTAMTGAGSGIGNAVSGSNMAPHLRRSFPSPIVSLFPLSYDTPQESTPEAMTSTICAAYDRSVSGKLMETALGVWEAIGRYGGDIPICAVIDCTSCIGTGSMELGTVSSSNGCNKNPQTGGSVNLRCQKDKQQRNVPVETQASALHKALLLLSEEVIRRDMLRRKG
ncbi:hypothetical protein MOQ_001009 [Trypanosoma cruzi marinkellei]|uniref:FYVE-type domain-containing protein n=1 Tax=Trypanosoma cruzi marinkellei TaxID=85056 RepID=K2MU39_TRYCR|nr:hypothetical protein MOQ_001009 [Trypanosoma cruzi marinkellei]